MIYLPPILEGSCLLAVVEGGCGKKDCQGGKRAKQDASNHVKVGEVSEKVKVKM